MCKQVGKAAETPMISPKQMFLRFTSLSGPAEPVLPCWCTWFLFRSYGSRTLWSAFRQDSMIPLIAGFALQGEPQRDTCLCCSTDCSQASMIFMQVMASSKLERVLLLFYDFLESAVPSSEWCMDTRNKFENEPRRACFPPSHDSCIRWRLSCLLL